MDVPAINQIVMLRNTKSSIVFTQQLGRGLRKFAYKDNVTVIDFIGNYANNFLIPVALYGRKGNPHKNIASRNSIGLSSISFDRISRERILKALGTADWSNMKRLSEEYRQIRFQIGRIPMLTDVYAHDPSLPGMLALRRSSGKGRRKAKAAASSPPRIWNSCGPASAVWPANGTPIRNPSPICLNRRPLSKTGY